MYNKQVTVAYICNKILLSHSAEVRQKSAYTLEFEVAQFSVLYRTGPAQAGYHFQDRQKFPDFSKFAAKKLNKCTKFVNTDSIFYFIQYMAPT